MKTFSKRRGLSNRAISKGPKRKARLLLTGGLMLIAASWAVAQQPPKGVLLHFGFDKAPEGAKITDTSDARRDGEAVGVVWAERGRQGGGVDFAATNSYIRVPSVAVPGSFSAMLWFRTAATNPLPRTLLDAHPQKAFALQIAGGTREAGRGKLVWIVNGQSCFSDGEVLDDSWRHVAATFDGKMLRLYVDGQLQKQITEYPGSFAPGTVEMTLGMNRSAPTPEEKGLSLEGRMDEVMLFDRALTVPEIQARISAAPPRFTRNQVRRRLIELQELYDRGLLLKEFYDRQVAECEADL
ncbi:MAG: LamG domain-containing protein [Kiritimatiellia bacterium]|nr:LamG domain-containing protein [Kiritimatiellia bacterium]